MDSVKVACLVAVLVAMVFVVDGAVSCGTVDSSLIPCINYLTSGGTVPPPCCNGVRSVNGMAQTTPDKQAVCGCLKQATTTINGINNNRLQSLPGDCGVDIPFTISVSTDCTKIK
ncbi:non-specific lipid-transfer protein 1 [Amborella trichopoda]|uniref:non-specific lipid-transfer protein 1 n=1 Tax=Amborella trichopoda TaxID=13333 RepID=UPI0005D358BF|nr:non-specific lipid-transfer protein 1 [Amborella trichopoda]|eukprot:XP_011622722.1 non-specific lipid-transfer protein 1 [Amborella trichopoda]